MPSQFYMGGLEGSGAFKTSNLPADAVFIDEVFAHLS